MTVAISRRPLVRLHLTNVAGAGASQLLQSLLPALERDSGVVVERIELPDRGKLADYRSSNPATVTEVYRRRLPNALSRMLECTWLAGRFDGESPILVLGDLPLRCRGPQTVFLQQSNLLKPERADWRPSRMKYALARAIFQANMDRVSAFIVQTNVMRDALERSYPGVAGKVHVIAQPVPTWLLSSGLKRQARVRAHHDLSKPARPRLRAFASSAAPMAATPRSPASPRVAPRPGSHRVTEAQCKCGVNNIAAHFTAHTVSSKILTLTHSLFPTSFTDCQIIRASRVSPTSCTRSTFAPCATPANAAAILPARR